MSVLGRRQIARIGALFAAFALLAQTHLAAADDHKVLAVDSFKQAAEAFEHGDYAAAARAFELSYSHVPRAAAMYNAARSWDAAGMREKAADDFETTIERTDLKEPEVTNARERLHALENELGTVEVTKPEGATVSVGHVDDAEIPRRIHLAPGDYFVKVKSAEDAVEHPIHLDRGQRTTLAIAFPKRVSLPRDEKPAEGSTQRVLGWTFIGVASAGAIGAVVLGTSAWSARDTFRADPTSQSKLDDARSLRLWANVAWIGAGAFAATGAVLLLTVPSRRSEARTAFELRPNGVELIHRF